jgi:hypothetical protein
MTMSGEIQTATPSSVSINGRGLAPRSFEDLWRIAKAVAASGLAPRDLKSPEQVFVAMAHGLEVGLPPMQALQRIAVINGRPTIWGDAVIGLVRASGLSESIAETFEGKEGADDFRAVCVAKRVGSDEVRAEYSVRDAKTAGLWGKSGPWTQHPKRMLRMRARAFALRDLYADVLGGMYLTEEVLHEQTPPQPEGSDRADRMNQAMRRVVENTATPPEAPTMAQDRQEVVGGGDDTPENSDAADAIVEPLAARPDNRRHPDMPGLDLDDPHFVSMFKGNA